MSTVNEEMLTREARRLVEMHAHLGKEFTVMNEMRTVNAIAEALGVDPPYRYITDAEDVEPQTLTAEVGSSPATPEFEGGGHSPAPPGPVQVPREEGRAP